MDQAKQFLAITEMNHVETAQRTVFFSPIFDCYGSDFKKKSGPVLAALNPYWPGTSATGYDDFKTRHTDDDRSLNERSK